MPDFGGGSRRRRRRAASGARERRSRCWRRGAPARRPCRPPRAGGGRGGRGINQWIRAPHASVVHRRGRAAGPRAPPSSRRPPPPAATAAAVRLGGELRVATNVTLARGEWVPGGHSSPVLRCGGGRGLPPPLPHSSHSRQSHVQETVSDQRGSGATAQGSDACRGDAAPRSVWRRRGSRPPQRASAPHGSQHLRLLPAGARMHRRPLGAAAPRAPPSVRALHGLHRLERPAARERRGDAVPPVDVAGGSGCAPGRLACRLAEPAVRAAGTGRAVPCRRSCTGLVAWMAWSRRESREAPRVAARVAELVHSGGGTVAPGDDALVGVCV